MLNAKQAFDLMNEKKESGYVIAGMGELHDIYLFVIAEANYKELAEIQTVVYNAIDKNTGKHSLIHILDDRLNDLTEAKIYDIEKFM